MLPNKINVILADDHPIYRDGIKSLLQSQAEMNLLGEARDGQELLELTRKWKPDVVLTDIIMPGMDGIEATKNIHREFPEIGIIALSIFNDDHFIVDMLKAGARGYLLKDSHKADIIDAIKTVHNHQSYYCRSTSSKLARLIATSAFNPVSKASNISFSKREKEVMVLLCKEYTSKEISDELNLSVRTVEGYRENILQKTESKNTVGIIIYALRNHIYQP